MTDLTPGSPAWLRTVTASKVAAILGHSPFASQRSMYHLMRGEYEQPVTDAMLRGQYLESGVLAWWIDQQPEIGSYAEQPSYRLGDWAAATPDMHALMKDATNLLVEAKTSANDDEWGRPGTDEIPTHYLTQCYWAMHVSGIHETRVPVLTSRLQFAEYVVLHDPEVGELLEARCREFYDSLSADTPPPLDDSVATAECMRRLHGDIDYGTTVEVGYQLAYDFVDAARDKALAEERERSHRSALYEAAGRAQYVTCNGVRIAARERKGEGVSLVRKVKDPNDIPETSAA